MFKVHYTPGDGKGWALDEDLRQIRRALDGVATPVHAAEAEIVHAPFWQNLAMVDPGILAGCFVIAHADNPPFFYLKQPGFLAGQAQVDLWVARSREAFEQFRALRLPVAHIPYAIDPDLFFPLPDKAALRREFGLPVHAYIIANFHRDSEGSDLATPKLQKAPELMMAILRRLRREGLDFHVLLAGPRRHWLRSELAREKISHTFVGRTDVVGDDFGVNILARDELNRLYNAADLHLIPSRWEGGPQSVMEAAACRCKLLSVPLGVARDILEPVSLFQSVTEAAGRLAADIRTGVLDLTVEEQHRRWQAAHTTGTMTRELRALYGTLAERPDFRGKLSSPRHSVWARRMRQVRHSVRRRLRPAVWPASVGWNHAPGRNADLDEVMSAVRSQLGELGVVVQAEAGAGIECVGSPIRPPAGIALQWIVPGLPPEQILPGAVIAAPSVQDVINLRETGLVNRAVVLPVPLAADPEALEPLVVTADDRTASLRVGRAMAAGRPIVHPASLAYFEQVFHGGLRYAHAGELDRVTAEARRDAAEFRELSRPVTAPAARRALHDLLRTLAAS